MDTTSESPRPIPKRRFYRALYELVASGNSELRHRLDALYAPDAAWRGSHPLNELRGVGAIEGLVWQPLKHAFPDLERRDLIFVGGRYQSQDLVATMGHYCGTFREDWLGIPATGWPVYLRYGEVHRVEDGRIVQSSCQWDVLDWTALAEGFGAEGVVVETEHQLGDTLQAAVGSGRTTLIAARIDGSAYVDQFNALREL